MALSRSASVIFIVAVFVLLAITPAVVSVDSDSLAVYTEIQGPTDPLNGDTDGDGLSDGDELTHHTTDPTQPDTDGDGLSDGIEAISQSAIPVSDSQAGELTAQQQTLAVKANPHAVDTDSDGLPDATEIQQLTDPKRVDTDGDGLSDGSEYTDHNTSATKTDTDSDRLPDGDEVQLYETSPTTPDTDADGLPDAGEIRQYQTSPTVSDSDSDNLSDGDEIDIGTNPVEPDTDGDGLSDGTETKLGFGPLTTDTDSDRLSDGIEYNTYGTDPTSSDTDSDGLSDAEEVQLGTAPTTADSDSDGLEDGTERGLGTSLLQSDTDNDGLPDGVEVAPPQELPADLSPLHTDVVIELDTAKGVSETADLFQPVATELSQAPLNNPDGQPGIEVHVVTSPSGPETSLTGSQSFTEYYTNGYQTEFDRQGYGVYHVLIVDTIEARPDTVRGGTAVNTDGMMIESSRKSDFVSSVAAHELGHQLGLDEADFSGIDSADYSYRQYSSVMNYNCRDQQNLFVRRDCGVVEFSSQEPFDDWQEISDSFPENSPDVSKLP